MGWTVNPLRCSEILAVLDLAGIRNTGDRWELFETIRSLDAVFLQWARAKDK